MTLIPPRIELAPLRLFKEMLSGDVVWNVAVRYIRGAERSMLWGALRKVGKLFPSVREFPATTVM